MSETYEINSSINFEASDINITFQKIGMDNFLKLYCFHNNTFFAFMSCQYLYILVVFRSRVALTGGSQTS